MVGRTKDARTSAWRWCGLVAWASVALGCGAHITPEQQAEQVGLAEAKAVQAAIEGGGSVALVVKPPSAPWIQSFSLSERGEQVMFATRDQAVFQFDTSSGELAEIVHLDGVDQVELIPGGKLVLALGGTPRIYGLSGFVEIVRFADWEGAAIGGVSSNGDHLLLARGDEVGVWFLPEQAMSYREGEKVQDFLNRQVPRMTITLPGVATAVSVGDSGNFVAALDDGGSLGTLFLWDKESPTDLAFLGRTNGRVREVTISKDERFVVAINDDDTVRVVQIGRKGFLPWAMQAKAHAADWTPSGALLLHNSDGTTRAVTPEDGSDLWAVRPAAPYGVCKAAGRRMVCTDAAAVVFLDGNSGQTVAQATAMAGQHITLVKSGAYIGNAEANWVALRKGGTDSPVSPAAFAKLANPGQVAAALAAWTP